MSPVTFTLLILYSYLTLHQEANKRISQNIELFVQAQHFGKCTLLESTTGNGWHFKFSFNHHTGLHTTLHYYRQDYKTLLKHFILI